MKEEWEFWERVEIPSPPAPNSLVEDLRILAIELNVLPENKISPHHTYMNSFHTYTYIGSKTGHKKPNTLLHILQGGRGGIVFT